MSNKPHRHLDLAVVGNCEVSALIDSQGRVVWMCLPRPDGDPVFSALLTRDLGSSAHGIFAVDLADLAHTEQCYVHNTAIVETTLHDAHGGAIRITDFCPRYRASGRMFRPMMLVRIITPIAGRPLVQLKLRPSARYGVPAKHNGSGSHHLRYSAERVDYRLTTDASITAITDDRPLVLDGPLTFILGPDETVAETPSVLGTRLLEETRGYWHDWVRTLAVPYEWQEAVIRAAITLKLCTFEDSGAVLAALTTSIPESANSGRNWDYRYCWLRDAYFVVQALNRLGATRTMEGYLHYIDHLVARAKGAELRPLYRITGDEELTERSIDSLEGFLGMGPVRIGNEAATQTQYDVYGSVILAATQLFFDHRLVRPGDTALYAQLESLGTRAVAAYEKPDAGPWEFRGTENVHTFSAAISWGGCDRLARIGRRLGLTESAERWQASADQMRERILKRAWSERRGAFTSALDGDSLDASILLLPEIGIVAATDPRFKSTVEAIGRDLRDGELLFRYRHKDDFGLPKAAFTVCAFWYVNALAAVGRRDEAREHFCALLARRNPLGLLSEDIDPVTGSLWGNFPQTYSLVGIINSALRLSQSWEDAL
jgi:GH15 family glucan-1,4-alpha-glucosidase